ncbi:MAG: hypothetical protein ACI4W6_07450 [Acutalibacteraceae bacterium]
MSFSKSWIILICAVSVISSVLAMVIPKSSLSKAFGYLCAAVMIYTFLLPFMTSKVDFSKLTDALKSQSSASQSFEDNAEETALTAAEKGCKTVILNKLAQTGLSVKDEDITVKCRYKNEKVEIERITVASTFSKEEKDLIDKTIKETFDEKINIIYSDGGEENG